MSAEAAQLETGEKAEAGHIDNLRSRDSEAPAARGVQFDNIPPNYWRSFRFLGSAFSVVLLASALFTNFNLPASALTVINADLGYSPAYIWISDASVVVSCVGMLIVGRLGDILGRRNFLIGGQVFGVVGSAICAKATSINMLVAGATIYGVATTTQLTFPFVIHELVPNKHRGVAQAIITVLVLPFAGFGSIIARNLIEYSALGWRWVYMINVIFNTVTLVLLAVCYFPPALNHLHTAWTWKTELRKLDYGGILIFTFMAVLILLGLNWGGSTYVWTDPHVLAPLIIGCVLIFVFGLYGFFSGWLDIVASVANGLVTEPGDLGLANGFLGSMKQLIGTISTSIYIAILSNRYAINYPKAVTAAALGAGLPESSINATFAAITNGTAAAYAAVPGMNSTIETAIAGGIKSAWASTFSTVYYASLAFAGLGIVAAFFSTDIDVHLNDYVNRRITGTEAMNVPDELTIKNAHLTDDE
ncbi:hypothetical protein Sste5346_007574 [Sporothrix stenoceras]|uniref:Major facilitator superfamily (MFS) profile domain-containing protein n=1 Tax=Sporothrix stenoceras TaxID=5173 RepID=A0ABR3YTB5_9PEZI